MALQLEALTISKLWWVAFEYILRLTDLGKTGPYGIRNWPRAT